MFGILRCGSIFAPLLEAEANKLKMVKWVSG